MTTTASHLLAVDDDPTFLAQLGRALRGRGYEVSLAPDAQSALACPRLAEIEAAVIDLRMPGADGLWLLPRLRQRNAAMRVLLLSGYCSIPTAVEAMRDGAVNCLSKPADVDQILDALGLQATVHRSTAGPDLRSAPSLARVEWEHIQRVLHDSAGNLSETARRLGLHRRTLQRKLGKNPPRT